MATANDMESEHQANPVVDSEGAGAAAEDSGVKTKESGACESPIDKSASPTHVKPADSVNSPQACKSSSDEKFVDAPPPKTNAWSKERKEQKPEGVDPVSAPMSESITKQPPRRWEKAEKSSEKSHDNSTGENLKDSAHWPTLCGTSESKTEAGAESNSSPTHQSSEPRTPSEDESGSSVVGETKDDQTTNDGSDAVATEMLHNHVEASGESTADESSKTKPKHGDTTSQDSGKRKTNKKRWIPVPLDLPKTERRRKSAPPTNETTRGRDGRPSAYRRNYRDRIDRAPGANKPESSDPNRKVVEIGKGSGDPDWLAENSTAGRGGKSYRDARRGQGRGMRRGYGGMPQPYRPRRMYPPVADFAGDFFYAAPPPFSLASETYFPAFDMASRRIAQQIEYYFSISNLEKDFFLRRKMDKDGWIPVSLLAGFHRVQALTQDVNVIVEAMKTSTEVETSADRQKMRTRHQPERWSIQGVAPNSFSTLKVDVPEFVPGQSYKFNSPAVADKDVADSNATDQSISPSSDLLIANQSETSKVNEPEAASDTQTSISPSENSADADHSDDKDEECEVAERVSGETETSETVQDDPSRISPVHVQETAAEQSVIATTDESPQTSTADEASVAATSNSCNDR